MRADWGSDDTLLNWPRCLQRDPADIAAAWHYFDGMHLLFDVTGIKGYPARGPTMPNETWPGPDSPSWHTSPTMPGWHFESRTSSDQIDGHVFVYPLVKQVWLEAVDVKQGFPIEPLLHLPQ